MSRVPPVTPSRASWWVRLLLWTQKRKYGHALAPVEVWGRSPKLLWRFLSFFRALERRSSPLDPVLRALITVKVSQINHCAFCIDFNAMRVLEHGEDSQAKLDGLADAESSEAFTESERAALAYAEAVTRSDREVDDELFQRIRIHYDEDAVVELTALIAFQNLSSKFNAALDIPSHGFCQLPAPEASGDSCG